MVNECTSFGRQNGLKFNITKIQFLVSGTSQIANPKISLNGKLIAAQSQLKHLGFNWQIYKNKISLKHHQQTRISELWATTSSLITCGIRKMHPNIIATIFRTIVVPKVLYGLEITDISKGVVENMDRQFRSALKLLLGLSKHCSNDLNKYFDLDSIAKDIKNRQINLILHLMKNKTTSAYLLSLLNSPYSHRSSSVLQNILDVCLQEHIDILDLLISQNFDKIKSTTVLEEDRKNWLQDTLSKWQIYENFFSSLQCLFLFVFIFTWEFPLALCRF